jgi:3-oxoacyl-[acyl-carrier-protein] synthase-3
MGIGITACSYCVPDRKLTHAELCQRFGDAAMTRVLETTGIRERRLVPENICASDLAFRAAEELLRKTGIPREGIDLILFASQTPDYLLPATACILQERLKLGMHVAAFDINLACSQYVYAHSVAAAMIGSGMAKRALVLTGDTVSRTLNPLDRAVVPLFGDAGTASLLEDVGSKAGYLGFDFGTDGSGANSLIWPASGLREPHSPKTAVEHTDKGGNVRRKDDMYMDGAMIMVFTLKRVGESVNRLLAKLKLTKDDIDLFVFHQASNVIFDSIISKLHLPSEKVPRTFPDYGNSGGSSVGVTLGECVMRGQLKPGMRVLLSAFGAGLSWCSAVLVWPEKSLGAWQANGEFKS